MDKLFYSYTSPWTSTSLLYSQNYPNSIVFHPATHRIMQNGVIYGNGEGGPIFIKGANSTSVSSPAQAHWKGASELITEYYEGLSVIYVPDKAGSTTTYLQINSLPDCCCYYSGGTRLTTHFGVGTPIMFTYMLTTTGVGMWKRADYDSNSNTFETKTVDGTADRSYYIGFYQIGVSNKQLTYTNTNLIYNPHTSTLETLIFKTSVNGYFEGDLHGNATTATSSTYSTTSDLAHRSELDLIKNADSSTNTYYLMFSGSNTNNSYSYVFADSGLKYVPSTNTLTASTFVGNLNGNASSANSATNATNTSYTKIDGTSTNASYYITFVNGTSGNRSSYVSTNLIFNPHTNTLTATKFNGLATNADKLDNLDSTYFAARENTYGTDGKINNCIYEYNDIARGDLGTVGFDNTNLTLELYEAASGSSYPSTATKTITQATGTYIKQGLASTVLHTTASGSKLKLVIKSSSSYYLKAVALHLSTQSTAMTCVSGSVTSSISTGGSWHILSNMQPNNTSITLEINTTNVAKTITLSGIRLYVCNPGALRFPGIANSADSAASASALSSTGAYKSWGQTFFNNGLPVTHDGPITNVESITPKTDLTYSVGSSAKRFANIYAGVLRLQGPSSNPSASGGARIEFTYDNSSSREQPVYIGYTPNDSYRNPAGLKVFGGTSSTPAWFEVEGSIYAGYSVYAKGVYCNSSSSGNANGLSLYGTSAPDVYGIAMRTTGNVGANYGKLGKVQGDWATFFTMNDTTNRGWIFRAGTTSYASISTRGEAYFNAIGKNDYIAYPNGGSSTGNAGTTTGAIAIKLPTTAFKSSTMIKFAVEIYNYSSGTSCTYHVAGYNYSDGNWYNISAYSIRQGTDSKGNLTVRFGKDSSRNIIWIGETNSSWSYPQVYVRDVTLGHSNINYDKWAAGWSVSFVTAFDTVDTSVNNPAVNYLSDYAKLLYPQTNTTTGATSTWSIVPTGCIKVWSEKFTDSSIKYTPSGGSATAITDSGDIVMWLKPSATANTATLNMRIDGGQYANEGFHHGSKDDNAYVLLAGGSYKALSDFAMGSTVSNDYVKKVGDTMTGTLTFNVGADGYSDSYSSKGINMGNSNITGVNSIYTADASDNSQEGIHFYRDSSHVDTIYAKAGVLYFVPNRQLTTNGTSYIIAHAGNITNPITNITTTEQTIATIAGVNIKAKITVSNSAPTLSTTAQTIATIGGTSITASVDHVKNTVTTTAGTNTTGATITIPYITTNAVGHVTNNGTRTHTVDNVDKVDGKHADDFLFRLRRLNETFGHDTFTSGMFPPALFELKSAGRPVYTDPEFANGTNSCSVYNNSGNGTVTITHQTDDQGSANSSGKILKIVTNGTASPGAGGFVQTISARANAIFVQIFRAKVPIGYSVTNASNSMGTSYQDKFITNRAGTGKWEWYARVVYCGASGTFSSGGHVYLSASSGYSATSVTWYLSYCNLIDITKANYDGLRTRYADQADTLSGTAIGGLFTAFSGGGISSDGNILTQANHSITIGGVTKTAGASTANIINSLSISKLTSDSTTNLTVGITVNGIASADKTLTDLCARRLGQTSVTNLRTFTHNTDIIYGAAGGSNSVTDKPTSVDAFGVLSLKTADGWYGQLLMSSNTAIGIYWRTAISLSGGWKKLLDSTNYTDYVYSKSTSDGRYVKLDAGAAEQTIKNSWSSTLDKGSIEIWRAIANGYAMIGFANGTTKTKLGMLGFGSTANEPIFRNTSGTDYKLAHAGNITDVTTNALGTSNTTIATIAGVDITAKVDHIKNTVTNNNGTNTSGATITIPDITVNAVGHVTNLGSHTHTINNLPFSSLPEMWWANIRVGNASSTDTEPTFAKTRIKTDEYIGTASGSQCHVKYDNTNKCLDFIFD